VNISRTTVSPSERFRQYWLPVLLMLAVQFSFSTNSFSSEETAKFINPFVTFLVPHITMEGLAVWHHVVRKAAHVTEYCILGVLVYRALQIDVTNPILLRMLTVIFVASAATMDEFHQSFVPSRTSSIYDVGFDCFGGMVGLLLIWVWRNARAAEE